MNKHYIMGFTKRGRRVGRILKNLAADFSAGVA